MHELSIKPIIRRKKTIVVVEDNPDQWLIIKSILAAQFPEVVPIWLLDCKQVIAYMDEIRQKRWELPSLILIDLYLPVRSVGWRILEILKIDPVFRVIPAIVLSASADEEDISESYMFRANSYVVKPMTGTEWQECFNALHYYWMDKVTLPNVRV